MMFDIDTLNKCVITLPEVYSVGTSFHDGGVTIVVLKKDRKDTSGAVTVVYKGFHKEESK